MPGRVVKAADLKSRSRGCKSGFDHLTEVVSW